MNALLLSFRQLVASLRFVWLIYGVTLVLGLLAALPFYNTLLAEDQNSREFLSLLDGFNYTVYADFMHRSSRAISPLLSVGRWLGVVYIFLSIFWAGGILFLFTSVDRRVSPGGFWAACSAFVGRYVRLFGVVVLFVLAGAIIWLVIGALVGVLLNDTLTERGLFWIGVGFFTLFILSATLILCIGDFAKVMLFRNDEQRVFRAFGQAGRLVLRNPGKTYGLYWLFIGMGTALFGLYFLVDDLIPMRNWPLIVLMLVVQQMLVFGRVGLKIWWLGMAQYLYEALPKPVLSQAPEVAMPSSSAPFEIPNKDVPDA